MDYSWDEDEAGARRQAHALVSRWARLCEEATGNEPTLWLVVRLTRASGRGELAFRAPGLIQARSNTAPETQVLYCMII